MRVRLHDREIAVLGRNMHLTVEHPRARFVLQNHRHGEVLDVGAGQGWFSLLLHNAGCQVTMMDIEDAIPPHPDISFLRRSVYDLDDVARWDTILLLEVIEHLERPELAIRNCYRALKEGGNLLLTTPWVSDWDGEEDHIWRMDTDSVDDMLFRYAKRSIYQDDTFVYAVVQKEAL